MTTIRCPLALSVDELCFELANHLQKMMIKEVWGAWPACPLHDGQHPIWATLRHGDACWECLDEPGYSVLIGHLRAG